VNDTDPRFPVIKPPPLKPVIAINVEPDKVRPAFVPESVPPPLLKSTVLAAVARLVSAKHESRTAMAADFIRRNSGE